MTIDSLVAMAERIHDAEGWRLGAGSSRDTRNAFWARVVGCAYHGHPTYNPAPDRQWHLKNGGGGRPQSDDVAVSMPSRQYWDCIGGVGADGYTFRATGHAEPLPAGQEVYPPPVPEGAAPAPQPTPQPTPTPQPGPECRFDTAPLMAKLLELQAALDAVQDEQDAQREAIATAAAYAKDCRAALQNGLAIEGKGTGLRWVGEQTITGVARG